MSHQQIEQTTPAVWAKKESSLPVLTHDNRIALDHLGKAFTEAWPLAVLMGEGQAGARYIIHRFLDEIEGDVTVVRLSEPCSDAIVGMRALIQAIGLEPKDMTLVDLDKIFTLFLSYQKNHDRRTIICIDASPGNGWWVLHGVRRLVELETEGKHGLMVILSGRPSLTKLLNKPPLDAICAQAGQRIALAPFTLAETREYVRREFESASNVEASNPEASNADKGHMFDFRTIFLIHELCGGIPDTVNALCCKCLELAEDDDAATVTMDLVRKAGRLLRLAPMMRRSLADSGSAEVELKLNTNDNDGVAARMILTHNRETISEITLKHPRLMIGRAEDNDICINSNLVSRHHAIFIRYGSAAFLMDLNSKNGTYVNSRRIREQIVIHQDIISIGDHRIKFIDPSARVRTTREGSGFDETVSSEMSNDMRDILVGETAQAPPIPQEFRKLAGDSN